MNKVEIKSDGPVEVTLNGMVCYRSTPDFGPIFGDTLSKPDRITITLTEREAELVCELTDRHASCGMTSLWEALDHLSPSARNAFDGRAKPRGDHSSGYASAERVGTIVTHSIGGGYSSGGTATEIRLTMDRDVAVTLAHLLFCVEDYRELSGVVTKLHAVDAFPRGMPRFTGKITWRKKRLLDKDLEVGKTYKLVDRRLETGILGRTHEWEEA